MNLKPRTRRRVRYWTASLSVLFFGILWLEVLGPWVASNPWAPIIPVALFAFLWAIGKWPRRRAKNKPVAPGGGAS